VLEHLVTKAWTADRAQMPECPNHPGERLRHLPDAPDFPVVLAVRMTLSFPGLISAVPLYMVDYATSETPVRCWFSDGGISSNFPIHLFDAPLPLWPTFAIDLLYPKSDDGDHIAPVAGQAEEQSIEASVFLPTENNQGWQRTYQSITRTSAAGELAGFLFGIIATMQNWRDLLQSRAPGHRDRIVHISLSGVEGGMNLNMPQPVLNRIASKGAAAGNLLKSFSFENHYWIRWRILASALQRHTMGVAASDERQPKIPDYVGAYQLVKANPADAPSYKFSSQEKRDEAQKLFGQLVAKGKEWEDLGPDLSQESPRPLPQMRIVPTY